MKAYQIQSRNFCCTEKPFCTIHWQNVNRSIYIFNRVCTHCSVKSMLCIICCQWEYRAFTHLAACTHSCPLCLLALAHAHSCPSCLWTCLYPSCPLMPLFYHLFIVYFMPTSWLNCTLSLISGSILNQFACNFHNRCCFCKSVEKRVATLCFDWNNILSSISWFAGTLICLQPS